MKKIAYVTDVLFFLFTTVYIYGIITAENNTIFTIFLILTIAHISYIIINVISRIKLNEYMVKEKLEAFKKEHNFLEESFEDIKSGRFNDLNEFKAYVGESNVLSILEKFSGKKRFIQNLIINNYGDSTSEIDVIMIHTSGIYVIESKNMYGSVEGIETEKNWVCDYGNKKVEFYNPVMQNDKHIKELKNLLATSKKNTFKSFVVFTDRLIDLKYRFSSKKGWIHVIKQSQLLEKVEKQSKYSIGIHSEAEVDRIADTLDEYKKSFSKNKELHMKKFNNI